MSPPREADRLIRLSAQGLACVRGGRQVFRDLGFTLEQGETLAVSGPNGAGKSSLLRLVAGLLRPSAGQVVLHGSNSELSVPEQVHYVGHQDALKPALTVHENLVFWAKLLGSPRAKPALAALGLDGLAQLPAGYLSAGQRRRLSLARLVAVERPIWLLDEPTSALDAVAQAQLGTLMRAHLAAGGLLLIATHAPVDLPRVNELRLGATQ